MVYKTPLTHRKLDFTHRRPCEAVVVKVLADLRGEALAADRHLPAPRHAVCLLDLGRENLGHLLWGVSGSPRVKRHKFKNITNKTMSRGGTFKNKRREECETP